MTLSKKDILKSMCNVTIENECQRFPQTHIDMQVISNLINGAMPNHTKLDINKTEQS